MKVIKRNQVVVLVIALMLVTAGYLNFIETNSIETEAEVSANAETIGDAAFVSSSIQSEEVEENILETNQYEDEVDIAKVVTSTKEEKDEYFAKTRLERDNMYSQIIESYQKMINSDSVTAEQKAIAQNEITKINNTKNAIMIAENLIKTKGFKDVVILVNNESTNVIIETDELKQENVAQIQNIVSREMQAEIENIHISSKKSK